MVEATKKDFFNRVKLAELEPNPGLILFIVIACLALNSKFDWVDDSYYIMLAKALATGCGYADIQLPEPQFHAHFPPGLPVFLSLPTLIGLDLSANVLIYKLMLIVCAAAALYIFSRFANSEGYARDAVWTGVFIACVSIALITFTTRVASELLYLLLSVAALSSLGKYERSGSKSIWLLVSALLLTLTILTRSIGVILLASAILSLSLRREFKRAAFVALTTIALWLPWLLLSKRAGYGVASYSDEFFSSLRSGAFAELAGRAIENGWIIINRDIPRIILSFSASEFVQSKEWLNILLLPIRLAISALTLLQIVVSLRANLRIDVVYVACYLLMVIMWPWDPGRYIVPMVPFICLYFISGALTILRRISRQKPNWHIKQYRLIFVLAAICVASHLISDARFVWTVRRSGHYNAEAASIWNEAMMAYDWIRRNTPQSSIIGCEPAIDPSVFLFTDRKAVALPSRPEAYLRLGITYIIHISDPTMYQGKYLKRKPDLQEFVNRASGILPLKPVYESANISIFEIDQTAGHYRD